MPSIYGIYKGKVITSPPNIVAENGRIWDNEKLEHIFKPYDIIFEPFQDEADARNHLFGNTYGVFNAHILEYAHRILHVLNDDALYSYNDHQGEWGVHFATIVQ